MRIPFEALAGGTIVLRDRRIVYASAGAAALAGRPAAEIVGRPFLDLLVPGERDRVSERYERRLRGEPVPTEYETQLLLPDGARRVVEVHVGLDGTDLVVEVRDVTALAARRPRLAAIAQLGAEIHGERREDSIFALVRRGLAGAGLAALLMRSEEDGARVVWASLPEALQGRFEAATGRPLAGFLAPWTEFSRTAWSAGGVYTDDWMRQVYEVMPGELAATARDAAAEGRLTRAVAVRIDEHPEPRFYLVAAGEWLRAEDLPAMRLFGAQVGAALDAARRIAGLARHNADLFALNRLGALAGVVADLDGFLAASVDVLRRSTGSDGVAIFTVTPEGDGDLVLRIQEGVPPEAAAAFAHVRAAGAIGELLNARTPRAARVSALSPERSLQLAPLGFATVAWVPLVARSGLAGLMALGWRAELADDAIRLGFLQAAGGQVAAAIESHGLLASLRGRLRERTLVNDVAMATAVLDPAALLDRALARVCETVEAEGGGAYVREGDALVLVASRGIPHGAVAPLRRLLPGEGAAGRAVERLEPVVIRDAAALGQRWHAVSAAGITQLLGVPLVAQSRAVGALVVGRRAGRDFTPDEVRLVAAIGAQVGLAVDNARLYGEARRRAEELGLVLEVGRSLVSTLHLDEVLDAGIRNVARIVEAPQAYLLLADRAGQTLEFRAAWGEDHSVVGERIPIGDGEGSLAAWAFVHRTPVAVDDARDPRLNADLVRRAGSRSHLALPLVVRDRAIGVAFIIETRRERTFVPAEVERAAAIANQLAIAVENARLYDDLSRSYAELAHAQRQLIQQERLAALGELAAVVAHEVRNPLGVIFNSLGSLRRLVRPTGDAEMLLDIVDEEADRLNRIVGDLLDFARPATPLLQLEPIERVVDDAVAAALARAAPGVKLAREVEAGLPPVPMDARLVHQAVLNVALNAVQAMPEGGRLRVRLARERDAVLVEVEDEGPGIPEEVRERVFEPFFTTKASGTGLGLAVVKRILDGHGGEVVARNREGAGAVFTLRFPLSPTPAGPPDEPVASRAPVG